MDLILLVLWLSIIGFVVWALTTYIPMPPIVKTAIYVATAIVIILFVARQFRGSIPNVLN